MKKITMYFLAFSIFVFGFANISLSVTKVAPKRAGGITAQKQKQNYSQTNKNPSVNRSAVNKRAASSNSAAPKTARAATTRSATARSAMAQRGLLRARKIAPKQANTPAPATTDATEETATEIATCPIEVVIKRVTDDNGTDVLYSSKDTVCKEPENVEGTSILNNLPVPSWMAGKYAYVFNCNYGYIKNKVDNVDVCVDESTVCPLNTIVRYSDGKYYDAETNQECSLPFNVSALKLTDELNTNPNIATDEAYYSYCKKNYYRSHDKLCKTCPAGKYTIGTQIKSISITDADGKVTGQKRYLVGDAVSEEDCFTLDEIQSIEWDENGNMKRPATRTAVNHLTNFSN